MVHWAMDAYLGHETAEELIRQAERGEPVAAEG